MKRFFVNLARDIADSVSRFFTTFCLTVLLFLVSSVIVIFEPTKPLEDQLLQIALTLLLGILLCSLAKLVCERLTGRFECPRVIAELVPLILSGASYFALSDFRTNQYISNGYCGVLFALFAGIVYLSDRRRISKTFAYIFKCTVFNAVACGIVTAGTMVCIFALHSLIYEFDNLWKVLSVNALFIWIVLFLNLSLSALPRAEEEIRIPNIFKVIVMYISLPVYLFLIFVLYVYLGKVLVTLSFPSGQINWFASFASLLFIFFVFALKQYREDSELARIFMKFGGCLIIPIIAMQFWSVYIRLYHYGLTSARYISVVLNVLALAFAVISLIKNGRFIKHMLMAVAGAALLLTVTPVNALDVPVWNQTARLTRLLAENNMLVEGKITQNKDVTHENMVKITAAYNYLMYSGANKPALLADEQREFKEIFGFSPEYETSISYRDNYLYYNYEYDSIDVAPYSALHPVSSYRRGNYDAGVFSFNEDGKAIEYDLTKDIEAVYRREGKGSGNVKIEIPIGEDLLILTNVGCEIDEADSVKIQSFGGYFLVR